MCSVGKVQSNSLQFTIYCTILRCPLLKRRVYPGTTLCTDKSIVPCDGLPDTHASWHKSNVDYCSYTVHQFAQYIFENPEMLAISECLKLYK